MNGEMHEPIFQAGPTPHHTVEAWCRIDLFKEVVPEEQQKITRALDAMRAWILGAAREQAGQDFCNRFPEASDGEINAFADYVEGVLYAPNLVRFDPQRRSTRQYLRGMIRGLLGTYPGTEKSCQLSKQVAMTYRDVHQSRLVSEAPANDTRDPQPSESEEFEIKIEATFQKSLKSLRELDSEAAASKIHAALQKTLERFRGEKSRRVFKALMERALQPQATDELRKIRPEQIARDAGVSQVLVRKVRERSFALFCDACQEVFGHPGDWNECSQSE